MPALQKGHVRCLQFSDWSFFLLEFVIQQTVVRFMCVGTMKEADREYVGDVDIPQQV